MDIDLETKYIQQLGDDDSNAFDNLFILYHQKLKIFLSGFIKDEELVSDMIQDIFVKVWINRKAISQMDYFKSYLFRMARNMIYDHYDHILIREKYQNKMKAQPLYTDMIEEELYADELSILIDIAIEKMPEQRKKIFRMSRKEGLNNEEIATRLKINKRTVENHITLALKELRKLITITILFFF